MSLILKDRFHPSQRQKLQEKIDKGQITICDELSLLEQEQLRPLASFSLLLLVIGAILFVVLTFAVLLGRTQSLNFEFSAIKVIIWVVINIVSYILILPVHEAIHALAFLLWGGRPYFGAKLPLALYCGARNQLFRRAHYLVVGLAPLVVITLAGIILTLLAPILASYVIFATIGNIAGAAGDLWVAIRLWRQPGAWFIEDTATGYRAWQMESV
ncbi:DUF3267 domain-containing protein [Ktedonosporobacter rubrisoli]|nr:DUF3267 domain-containing protein [Ktedonosporobacter rubrisoli]